MYHSMRVQDFRAFEDVSFRDFARVNLFLGPNNAGKTSALEAIYLHACGARIDAFIQGPIVARYGRTLPLFRLAEALAHLFRGRGPVNPTCTLTGVVDAGGLIHNSSLRGAEDGMLAEVATTLRFLPTSDVRQLLPWDNLISGMRGRRHVGDVDVGWRRGSSRTDGGAHVLEGGTLVDQNEPLIEASWTDLTGSDIESLLSWYATLARRRDPSAAGEALRAVFRDVPGPLVFLPYPDGNAADLGVHVNGAFRSLATMGEGTRRWLKLLLQVTGAPGSCAFVDEIDAAFHPYVDGPVARALMENLVSADCQLFASTHNLEFVDGWLRSIYEGEAADASIDPVAIYTLRFEGGKHIVRRRAGREAWRARVELEAELRT